MLRGNDGTDASEYVYRSPVYDVDVLIHEFMHIMSMSVREKLCSYVIPSLKGVEEAFCDLFAMQFTEWYKDQAFHKFLAPSLAYQWREVETIKVKRHRGGVNRIVDVSREDLWESSVIIDEESGEFAKRNFNSLAEPNPARSDDEHFHGRQLLHGLLTIKDYLDDNYRFYQVLWDVYLTCPKNRTILQIVRTIMNEFGVDSGVTGRENLGAYLQNFVDAWSVNESNSTDDDRKLLSQGPTRVR